MGSDSGDTLETPQNVISEWISKVAEFLTQEIETFWKRRIIRWGKMWFYGLVQDR